MKILIADDEPFIRQGLTSIPWESLELAVCGIAKDGAEALKLADIYRPDIILSDIRMPGMSGLEFIKKISDCKHDSMVIFLSGYSDFQYAQSAIQLGAFDYLLKPTSPDEILSSVGRAVEALKMKRSEKVSFRQMQEQLQQLQIKERMNNLPAVDCQETAGNAVDAGFRKTVESIIAFIMEHYMDDISLSTLAEQFHFNPIYINRILKKETGHTFLDILINLRMNKSIQLLKETDLKVSQIAEQVGINDQRYFSQVFKRTFGCTPVHFRKLPNITLEAQTINLGELFQK